MKALEDMVLLVTDDDVNVLQAMSAVLGEAGASVLTAASGPEALDILARQPCDGCLIDLSMPGMDGLELLRRIKHRGYPTEVIVITGYGSVRSAVTAMREGAFEYISKPVGADELLRPLMLVKASRRASSPAGDSPPVTGDRSLIGAHPRVEEVRWRIGRAASSDITVLITGETGTGKELVARAIHREGTRRDGPFVRVHCGALAQDLLLSELFGHERGAFTGAHQTRRGHFERAHGGTIFLDEVGSASERTQVSLLRVLQEREFERVGGDRPIRMEARVIAATNRNIESAVTRGEFRLDLYYRLRGLRIDLPPLRDRPADIPLLAAHFLVRAGARHGRAGLRIDPDALGRLQAYAWPGNVRELEQAVESAVAMARTRTLNARDLLPDPDAQGAEGWTPGEGGRLEEAIARCRRAFLVEALHRHGGDVALAARAAGVPVRTFYRQVRACGIDLKDTRG